jgi:D-alanyl-D-alanine carboxypeptidase
LLPLKLAAARAMRYALNMLRRLLGLACVLFGLVTLLDALFVAAPASAETTSREAHHAAHHDHACRLQSPQRFLERRSFVKKGQLLAKGNQRAVDYRVEHYGTIPSLGLVRHGEKTVASQIVSTTFMGLPVRMHEKIVPALHCVQEHIRRTCTKKGERYTPKAIGGYRDHNTYRGGEVSNHMFGIAIDIDPARNPCCGCVKPWPSNPLCKKHVKSIYGRIGLTRCWVHSFERYGFYWLGNDTLRDTMHFEFLGNPDRIRR